MTDYFHIRQVLIVPALSFFLVKTVNGQESAEKLFFRAYYYINTDKEKALDLLTQAITQDSTYKDAFFHRGIMFFKMANYGQAIEDFDQAYTLDPGLDIIWMYKGFAYRNQGRLDDALACFSNYIIENPTDTSAYSYIIRGKMKYELGDFEGAVEDYDMAVKLKPFEEKYYYYRFMALYEAKEYKKALQSVSKLIQSAPGFYGYYFYKGNIYQDLGYYDSAIYMYNVAIIKNYQNADSYFYRAECYKATGEFKKALEDYNTAIMLKDSDGYYFSARGNCKYEMGDKEGACEDWGDAGTLGYYEDYDKVKRFCGSK